MGGVRRPPDDVSCAGDGDGRLLVLQPRSSKVELKNVENRTQQNESDFRREVKINRWLATLQELKVHPTLQSLVLS